MSRPHSSRPVWQAILAPQRLDWTLSAVRMVSKYEQEGLQQSLPAARASQAI